MFSDLIPLSEGHHLTAPPKTVTNHWYKKKPFSDLTALWLRFGWVLEQKQLAHGQKNIVVWIQIAALLRFGKGHCHY